MEAHETDYQRGRRQHSEVKKFGVTGSTPKDASKRIAEHTASKSKAIHAKMGEKKSGFDSKKRWGNSAMKGHGVNSPAMMEAREKFNKS